MKSPKSSKKKRKKSDGVARFLQFLVRHGEKLVAGALIVAAVWIALQALQHQPLPWQPETLEELADNTRDVIKATDKEIEIEIDFFDYSRYAEQIRERIPSEPYRADAEWFPLIHSAPLPRSGFAILTAESLKGEAIRQIGLTEQRKAAVQRQRPPQSGAETPANSAIWVNFYAAIPLLNQWEIYDQTFGHLALPAKPEYVYYELERAEIKRNAELVWQPFIVNPAAVIQADTHYDFSPERLIPFTRGTSQEQYADSSLLLSDFDIEPAKTYAYRIRLYLVNPNYNVQETSVEEGVDTKNEIIRSDWSFYTRVFVPDRVLVQLHSVTPADPLEFPRQLPPLRPTRGTLILDYFDMELGQSLPLVEKREVTRGMLANMSKDEANNSNRSRSADDIVNINYPDAGLRSDVCVMDLSGGRPLQKRLTREAQTSPDLSVVGRALLLMPDRTMQTVSTEPELFQ